MLTKLDKHIIRSFIGPFIVTFFIAVFVFVMQFFWVYMDELIGKGLGVWMISQLLFYMSATMVPLALPLAILLASIMTLGSMGENMELIAIKSSGISLLRVMRPLLFLMIGLGGLAFLFNNNFIPVANLKALSLLYDLRNSKPTLNIKVGQYNKDIQDFVIRVGEKDNDGRTIRNISIYDHSSGYGNDNLVLANEGEMIPMPENKLLIFRLKDGWRYKEDASKGPTKSYQQTRMHFRQWDKVFDLSGFKVNRTDEALFKGAYQMMNVRQLNEAIDSVTRQTRGVANNVSNYLGPYISTLNFNKGKEFTKKIETVKSISSSSGNYTKSFIERIPAAYRARTTQFATSHVRNAKGLLDITSSDKKIQTENFLKYNIEWHRKFTLSFACLLLFFIGAPLGAIIRKGGFGLPMLFAIIFFLTFHIASIIGEKLVRSQSASPWVGMWMSTAMLLPIAFYLINAAMKDSQVFSREWYTRVWMKMKLFFGKKTIA